MNQHTPGPWEWVIGPHVDALLVRQGYRFGDPYILAPEDWGQSEAIDEANARLIAKAPEMYAALKDILANYTAEHLDNVSQTTCGSAARALLREIEGEDK